MEKITAKVRRQGLLAEIPASQLVPGDVVIIEGGDMVSADVRLIRSSKLEADESMLTGESLPVGKHFDAISASAILVERTNMLFKGTAVTRGSPLRVDRLLQLVVLCPAMNGFSLWEYGNVTF